MSDDTVPAAANDTVESAPTPVVHEDWLERLEDKFAKDFPHLTADAKAVAAWVSKHI